MAMTSGGQQWSRPSFEDAVPPTPPMQGDMGPEAMGHNRVDEHTFESGMAPANTGAIESMWSGLVDDDGLDGHAMDFTAMAGGTGVANKGMGEGIRGFRSTPVGGTYHPGQGKGAPMVGTERSGAS
jgi:hypothetical protein